MPGPELPLRDVCLDWLFLAGGNAGLWVVIDIRHPNPKSPGREGGVSRTPGAADIVVLTSLYNMLYGVVEVIALAIELKGRNRKQSDDQVEWQAKWEAQGGIYIVIRDSKELPGAFERLGLPMREVVEEA